ncbi:MAG: HD domain-containing protein [Nanoarchaeota archaeon]
MIEKIKVMILGYCKENDQELWTPHITSVVKNAKLLAKKLDADEEVCEIAAWLHDIIKVRDGIKEMHHVKGSEEAERILTELNYPKEKIAEVKHCILTHSSDKRYPPESVEAKIVASADAMAHFEHFLGLAYYVFHKQGYSIEESRAWLKNKYKVAWSKLMPEAQELMQERYDAIKLIIG